MLYFRSQITWAHGALLFHSGKRRSRHTRVSVSSKGCIKIKNIEPFDSGTYTCMGEYSTELQYSNAGGIKKLNVVLNIKTNYLYPDYT